MDWPAGSAGAAFSATPAWHSAPLLPQSSSSSPLSRWSARRNRRPLSTSRTRSRRSRPPIGSAPASGKGTLRITLEHVLPNIASLLIVQATIQFGVAILAEAGRSYLGLGTQPPNPSWGRMLNEAQTFLFLAPRLAIYPGLAIVLAVLGVNLLGDGLRDVLDPRLMRRR